LPTSGTTLRPTSKESWFIVVPSLAVVIFVASAIHHLYFDRANLCDLGSFTRFEFSAIGRVYDANGQPLIEFAREYRQLSSYEDIPPIVRDAILAAEAKRSSRTTWRDTRAFPIAVMGKTGTTKDFKDALFVGSIYGTGGVTVAVRIGFDDGQSLGPKETGGRVALPVFQEVMLRMYGDQLAGPVPSFPPQMEQRITQYLQGGVPAPVAGTRRL
jgi:membrane carboxypeptidase/penicillin-binding protein